MTTNSGSTFSDELVYRWRWPIAFILIGMILAAGGVFLTLRAPSEEPFQVINGEEAGSKNSSLIIEVSGAVNNPGVYELEDGKRIEDALLAAGGFSDQANNEWIEKHLNRAAFVTDGQKIYVPWQGEESSDKNTDGDQTTSEVLSVNSGNMVNINTASQKELDGLRGIGPVYAQKIIDNRPYSNIEELSSRDIIPQKVFDENKELLSVY